MIKINRNIVGLVAGFGALALLMTFAAPRAQAAEVNILVGQDMTLGATGQGVVVLQGLLQELGYMNIPAGVSMGYYGALTKEGLGRYQSSQSVAPAAGYFGPVSKVTMHQQFLSKGWLTLLGW